MPSTGAPIIHLRRDMTLRWSCRTGDYVLWMRTAGFFARDSEPPKILDFWQLSDGDFITITNRAADLPSWFELHHTEAFNTLAYRLVARIEKEGYAPPDEPMDGPNLWRLRVGDRVAWVGESRPGQGAVEEILTILDCQENALLIGETTRNLSVEESITFGGPRRDATPKDVKRCQAAVRVVQTMGLPNCLTEGDWGIG